MKIEIMKIKIALYMALFMAVIASCSVEQATPYDPVLPDIEGDDATARMTLIVPETSEPTTYAMTATQENAIQSIDILSFIHTATNTDTFAYRVTVNDPSKIVDAVSAVNGDRKTVDVKLRRHAAQQKLVVIANATSIIDAATIATGDQLEAVMQQLIYNYPSTGKWNAAQPNPTPFPMWGLSTLLSVKDPVVMTAIEVSLIRNLAKVNVGVDIFAEDPAIGFASHFKIKHVYVCGINDRGYVSPVTVASNYDATNKKVLRASVPSGATIMADQLYTYPATGHLINEIYIPEADTLVAVVNRVHLVIGAEYDGGAEKYYRMDFAVSSTQYYQILRNHRYTFNIRGVLHDGYDTPATAGSTLAENLEYDLTVSDEGVLDYLYDGQYYIGTTYSQIISSPRIQVSSTGKTYGLDVMTNYGSGAFSWATSGGSFLTVTPQTGRLNLEVSNTMPDNVYYRDEYVSVQPGATGSLSTLNKIIPVRQFNLTSCILVNEKSSSSPVTSRIYFKTANLDGETRVSSANYELHNIWVEANMLTYAAAPSNTYGDFAYLDNNSTYYDGNALMGVFISPRAAGDKPLWTWHIWRMWGYNPDSLQQTICGVIFMDRNIGAVNLTYNSVGSFGLFYQWGRKEPFLGANAQTGTTFKQYNYWSNGSGFMAGITSIGAFGVRDVSAVSGLPEYAHRNPHQFITSTSAPYYTWEGLSGADNSLWASSGVRSPNDPCPVGWRVPTSAEMMALFSARTSSPPGGPGVLFERKLCLPYAGGIDFSTGQLFGVGTDGYYWTSDTSGATAKVLHIRDDGAGGISMTIENAFRANGYSVRCVKDKI